MGIPHIRYTASQAARQGLAVLMASDVGLKHETYLVCNKNLFISETMHRSWEVIMKCFQLVMVAFLESVMTKCVQRPRRMTNDDVIYGWQ